MRKINRPIQLSLKHVFRRFAQRERDDYANQIRNATPKKRPDGRLQGGSFVRRLKLRTTLKIRDWGYVIRYFNLTQKLTWYVRGTVRQIARPAVSRTASEKLAGALEKEIAKQFSAWDKRHA